MRKITDDAEAGHVTTRVVMNEIIRMDHAGIARSRSPLKQARKKKPKITQLGETCMRTKHDRLTRGAVIDGGLALS